MLATYVRMLSRRRLVIDALVEPRPPDEWTDRRPDAARLPTFLVARARPMRALLDAQDTDPGQALD
jgi:hypothetical protein